MVVDKNKLAMEVLGSGMGPIELRELGLAFGLEDEGYDDIDLQVAIIAESEGVWRCETCDWWVEESDLHNGVCSECYAADHDE